MRSDDPAPAADLRDAARLAESRAARRLALLAGHLAAPEAGRFSDYEAATVGALVDGLVAAAVADFAATPAMAGRGLETLAVPLATRDPDLIERALARATEHRLRIAIRARPMPDAAADRDPPADPEAAALELALLVAESRRIDRAGDPLLRPCDLPAESAHRLAWRIAAAARDRCPPGADPAIADAVATMLAGHDEDRGIAAAALRLARARRARIDEAENDAMLVDALARGQVALFAGLLAERAGLGFDAVHGALGDPVRLALMLRAAGVARAAAAALLLQVTEALALDDEALIDAVEGFGALDAAAAAEALVLARLDPAYRAAIAERGA